MSFLGKPYLVYDMQFSTGSASTKCQSAKFILYKCNGNHSFGKENQMRSPDLEFHLENRIFDLDRLRGVETNKF